MPTRLIAAAVVRERVRLGAGAQTVDATPCRFVYRLALARQRESIFYGLALSRRSRMGGWSGRTMAPWLKAVR